MDSAISKKTASWNTYPRARDVIAHESELKKSEAALYNLLGSPFPPPFLEYTQFFKNETPMVEARSRAPDHVVSLVLNCLVKLVVSQLTMTSTREFMASIEAYVGPRKSSILRLYHPLPADLNLSTVAVVEE